MGVPVIVGGGLAGLAAALACAPCPVLVLGRRSGTRQTSSELAQGGLAAPMDAQDSVEQHVADTLAAGAGLCDQEAAFSIIGEGPLAVERLLSWGVPLDREEGGALRLGLEGAHSRRRIVHAQGDSSGEIIMRHLVALARRTPSITFIEDAQALRIEADGQGVSALVFASEGGVQKVATRQIVLATGSACALWCYTPVPTASWGQGLALADGVGARFRHLEFVQFHPTALDTGTDPLPLMSEALRGEGAKLVTPDGRRFTNELAPRDIVARALDEKRHAVGAVYLDARGLADFGARFPTITRLAAQAGLNPLCDLLPVRPAAHYHMGGIETDLQGRSSVSGLWACGEVACTGLHGANRLASNSLLEAVVMGLRVGAQLEDRGQACLQSTDLPLPQADPARRRVREIMEDYVGLRREAQGLTYAVAALESLAPISQRAQVGLKIARAALARQQSIGAHCRTDFPAKEEKENERVFA